MRGLSKSTAMIIGVLTSAGLVIFGVIFSSLFGGLIPIIILCGVLGGGIGFALPLIFKGITGKTPQERKELQRNDRSGS